MKTQSIALVILIQISALGFGMDQADKPESLEKNVAYQGRALFEQICMACHKYERQQPMLAPPVFAVKDHYTRVYSEEKDFVDAVVAFVSKPDAEKALMPGAIAKFNLMPPLPLPREQLESIASFIFRADLEIPDWYDAHYKAEHGDNPPNAK